MGGVAICPLSVRTCYKHEIDDVEPLVHQAMAIDRIKGRGGGLMCEYRYQVFQGGREKGLAVWHDVH